MDDEAPGLPARDIALSLMRSALVLLDHAGEVDGAAALQNAIDIADEMHTPAR